MKKYRLIGYNPNNVTTNSSFEVTEYTSIESAYQAMQTSQVCSPHNFYRIEEVEESIMDKVKTYEDACEVLRHPISVHQRMTEWIELSSTCLTPHLIALLKLETITSALNEGWKPDWEDKGQKRYGVCYDLLKEELYASCERDLIKSPAQLLFKSRELAEYAAKQFAELYKQLLTENF